MMNYLILFLTLKYFNEIKINKRKSIPAPLKRQVWEIYISTELRKGKCFCCKTKDIMESDFHCAHVISHKNKGKIELENLRPTCSQCNLSMGSNNMYDYISKYINYNKPYINELLQETYNLRTILDKYSQYYIVHICSSKIKKINDTWYIS